MSKTLGIVGLHTKTISGKPTYFRSVPPSADRNITRISNVLMVVSVSSNVPLSASGLAGGQQSNVSKHTFVSNYASWLGPSLPLFNAMAPF